MLRGHLNSSPKSGRCASAEMNILKKIVHRIHRVQRCLYVNLLIMTLLKFKSAQGLSGTLHINYLTEDFHKM